MAWWLNLIPFGKTLAVKAVMMILDRAVEWYDANVPEGSPEHLSQTVHFIIDIVKKWIVEEV